MQNGILWAMHVENLTFRKKFKMETNFLQTSEIFLLLMSYPSIPLGTNLSFMRQSLLHVLQGQKNTGILTIHPSLLFRTVSVIL
jgi:hypothetical protein